VKPSLLVRLGLRPAPLTPATEERLGVMFPGQDQSKAREIISWMPSYFSKDSVALERFRFALLKLSNGDIGALEEWKDALRADYRDVLIEAGFANDVHAHSAWFPTGPGLEAKTPLAEKIPFTKKQKDEIRRIVEERRPDD
jgi:hypothetical protein